MLLTRLMPHVLSPRAILLSDDVILFSVSDEAARDQRFFSGREPPYGTVDVISTSGICKIAAMRLPKLADSSSNVVYSEAEIQAREVGESDFFDTVIFSPDILELVEDLDASSKQRVLAFLLGFCIKAFSLGDRPAFASACLQLARLCIPEGGTADVVADATSSWTVLGGLPALDDTSLFILNERRVRRSKTSSLNRFPGLHLIERVISGDVLLALGEQPALYLVDASRAAESDLLHSAPESSGLRAACLHALASFSRSIAAHLREAALLSPAQPRKLDDVNRPIGAGLEVSLPDGEGRLFMRGWIRDPMDLVSSIELASPHGITQLRAEDLHWFRRSDVDKHFAAAPFSGRKVQTGFVAFPAFQEGGFSLQPMLSLRLHSGARVDVQSSLRLPLPAMARTAVLASVPPEQVTDAMLDNCLGPAAASFHRSSLSARGTPELIRIGTPASNPTVSIIIPLFRNLSFLRFQFASFARDPECRAAELVMVLDSPEQAKEAEHLLRGLHALHDLPVTLVVQTHNLGYAASNNVAAAFARAPVLLLLNSDVVPTGRPWLGTLAAALAQKNTGVVGPKLLFDDDSIQHAGLYFQRDLDGQWLNAHYHKGMPRFWPGASKLRRVPGVTGAALLVKRDLFEMVGGICEDYIIGDYEDSDFCLRLHAAGVQSTYVPTAELYHFERRSIEMHKGYTGTLACRYNRRLHHQRWNCTIAALMTEPEFGSAGATS